MSKKTAKRTAPDSKLASKLASKLSKTSASKAAGKLASDLTSKLSKKDDAAEEVETSRGPDFLPFDAEFRAAPVKRFQETVVFVHQFGGTKESLNYHAKMVNDLGYDAVLFNLMFCKINPTKHFPITADLKFGIRHVWSEQIEAILNSTPGRKILFSFSMPSNSVLMALAHRHAKDVSGWVADGGPFLQLPTCVWNLYAHHYEVKSKVIRGALTGASLVFYGSGFEREAASLMRALPRNFKILSFRGMQDPMVPADAIDEVLIGKPTGAEKNGSHRELPRVSVETHSFEEGVHLDGLKHYREAYVEHCETFLKSVSKPV